LVTAKGQAIACLTWCSAPRHLASRDRFIGWSAEARQRNLRLLAYDTRFLIALGRSATLGVAHSGPHGEDSAVRLTTVICASGVLAGNVYRPGALQRHLLSRSQLAVSRQHDGSLAQCAHKEAHAARERLIRSAVLKNLRDIRDPDIEHCSETIV
jgi:Domain of unknown function (DUF4338)